MKETKYYVVRIDKKTLVYLKDEKGKIFEFDSEKEVRAEMREQERNYPFWFIGWKKEEVEI